MAEHAQILIAGAGFSGLATAIRLKQQGKHDFVVLERAEEIGGVWQLNTYPGCTCDVPSHLYSLSFAPNPDWTHTYSPQPEIRDYLRRTAERFGIQPHIRTGVAVESASWSEDEQRWTIMTSAGDFTAAVFISAVGPLTEPNLPDVRGLEDFEGKLIHSARWDHGYDLTGKRVASIGTGASAIQYVPQIVDEVGQLYVFQRTPPWVMPHGNRAITEFERTLYRLLPAAQQLVRRGVYASREILVLGMVKYPRLLALLEKVSRAHMRKSISDPELLQNITPDYTVGCKRIVPSNAWYPALQKPHVTLVPHALREVREHSVVGADGVERDVDVIIFATGYHVADIPFADHIRGRDGGLMSEMWSGSPRAYLGTSVPGFPNFFLFLGPNTGLGHSSMILMIEAQIEHIAAAIRTLDVADAATIEVDQQVHDAYNRRIDQKLATTVWEVGGCTSFYRDANGRNASIYPDWTWRFRRDASRWRPEAYRLRQWPPTRDYPDNADNAAEPVAARTVPA